VLETVGGPSLWVGHSFGGRLVLELAARRPELVRCAVLLDPAIDILPHVGFDFAQDAATDREFASADEAIDARLTSGSLTPRSALEEEAREHLVATRDGKLRWRYARAAVATMYSELCRKPPPPTALAGIPTLLVHAEHFGLVREEQLEEYPAALGDGLELVGVPGGHVVYWDAFVETADAVERFLIHHSPVSQA
jgi:lipase